MHDSLSAPTYVSVIIPTLNEAGVIRHVLQRIHTLPGHWDIIVADSGSTDGTRDIVADTPFARLVDVPRGRGAAMNAGSRAAVGDILLFLHADTRLPDDAYRLITGALGDPDTSATAFRLRLDRTGFPYSLVPLASRVRIPVQRTFFGDQAIAVRTLDFECAGGYRESTLMEDVDLSRRMRRIGRLQLLPAHVVTSARRFERHGVFRTLAFMSCLQVAYAVRVPVDHLARRYGAVR